MAEFFARRADGEQGLALFLNAGDPPLDVLADLLASPHEDLRLVCVFSPALRGDEVHQLDQDDFSEY